MKCPACGKRIIFSSSQCKRCGYVFDLNQEQINGTDDRYTLTIIDCGKNKIQIIKSIREITCIGLADAKNLADNLPCVLINNLTYEESEIYKNHFLSLGANVEIKKEYGFDSIAEINATDIHSNYVIKNS